MNNYTSERFESALLGEHYQKIDHPSGLSIYVFPKKMSATYALFGTKYGSINNVFRPFDKDCDVTVPDGIAHFLEHKLFFNEDGSDSFERFTALGADANAYTTFDKTVYLFSCTHNLDASLEELVTFVTHPYFTDESVKKEIGIIAEEIKMYEDNPSNRCFYGMLEGMYKSHSVKRNICGSEKSIKQITPELLYGCYNAFYRLDNMALVICGDVDAKSVLRIVDPLLPKSSTGRPTLCINENEAEEREAYMPLVEQKMQVAKPLFDIGFKDVDISSDPRQRLKKCITMAIINDVLFAKSGSLYSSLLDRRLISPNISCVYNICHSFAFNNVSGEADDPKLVCEEILKYIDSVRERGIEIADFERTKKVMYAEWVMSFDSTEDIANELFNSICEGSEFFDYADVLNEITLEDVNELLRHSFDKTTMTLSIINPLE
ncbi:MAG: insulinase family protein [Ruminococcaceae bacterium]|nr:insulinase family protein [Oscillospiraceae bacterium]